MAAVLKSQPYLIIKVLQRLLFQFLHVLVDVAEFVGDADVLWAVRYAAVAADAVCRLTFRLYYAVVTDEETAAGFLEVLVLDGYGDVSLVDALIIMCECGRDVNAIRTRHAVLTRSARHKRKLYELVRHVFKEFVVLFGAGLEGTERGKIVLKMLHIRQS